MISKNKHLLILLLALAFLFSFQCKEKTEGKNHTDVNEQVKVKDLSVKKFFKDTTKEKTSNKSDIPDGLKKLKKAYPDFIDSVDNNHLYFKDGTKMIYDDGREKTFEEKLEDPDLEDMMSQEYPMGRDYEIPDVNEDPGRIRYEPFFMKIYGSSASEVKQYLVSIKWMPKSTNATVTITSRNGVNIQLKAVSDELDKLPQNLKKYVTKTAGTFYWRNIAGTNRLSAHSFGIAIDINTEYSDYWQWDKNFKYKNRIPLEIVEIFENYGFIWGGKWYHYDTMHFEYRPELLVSPD